ncbi:MAG TPA: preprotein translocase subunit YajC [Bacteroidia bacterium]|nr:preprotein translocase subunit YajC [Bacteroidia bacterium]
MNSLAFILLLGGSPQGGGGGLGSFLPLILIMVVFYVFMILPQTRKAKAQKKFREELKKGDKIVNIAGIHGKIVEMDDTSMVIELEEGVRMRIERSSVSMEATKALNNPAGDTKK